MKQIIRIGTRKSPLAMAQTRLVIEAIQKADPSIECEIVSMMTKGDKILDRPLLSFGGKGGFVTEFEEALADHTIDLAIHSAKDMPMDLAEGMEIVGTLERADVRDVLISNKGSEKPFHCIGTSSLRRKSQIEKMYQVECKDLRGNVGTRLQKLKDGQYDAIILAAAGIKRLGLEGSEEFSFEYLEPEQFIPAAGQAIIAIEGRKDDPISKWIKESSDQQAMNCLEAERNVLHLLDAGCHEPIGVYSRIKQDRIKIVLYYKGENKECRLQIEGAVEDRILLGKQLVEMIGEK